MGLIKFISTLSFSLRNKIIEEKEYTFLSAYGKNENIILTIEIKFIVNGLKLKITY